MGWPKKNEGLRLYFERKDKSYLLVEPIAMTHVGCYKCIGELFIHNDPEKPVLASSSCDSMHLYKKCNRVSWNEIPKVWQKAFIPWLTKKPKEYRGLWRTKNSLIDKP